VVAESVELLDGALLQTVAPALIALKGIDLMVVLLEGLPVKARTRMAWPMAAAALGFPRRDGDVALTGREGGALLASRGVGGFD
jgi:hypothetical protein